MTEFNKTVLKKSLTAAFITGIISISLITACATVPEQKEIKSKEPEANLTKVYVSMGRYVESYSAKKIEVTEISGQKLIKLYLPDNKVINVINAPVLWESDK